MKKFSLTIITLALALIFANVAYSQTITIQGVLTNSSGVPLPDGTYEIEFKLYEVDTGGIAIWSEFHTVSTTNGIFNASLAATEPFNIDFSSQYWLGIIIESGTEVSPRIEFSWSPYAFYALTIADNSVTSDKIVDGAIAGEDINQMGATNGQVLTWNGTVWTPDDIAEQIETDPLFTTSPANGIAALDITNWNTAFGWGDHSTAGYLTEYTETDPLFTVSPANGIAAADITNWDNAYGWGDHAAAGYLTEYTETDPLFTVSPANGIAAADITNWNTAFGWGDHAAAGYLTEYTETDPIFVASPANGIAAADITNWDNAYGWGDHAAEDYIADGDAAGGDLDGFYPDPTIADNAIDSDKIENGSIIGEDIHQMSAINGQVLKWNGTQWAPGADVGGGAGDDWGAQVVQKDATLTGSGITGDELGLAQQGATLGQALIWDGSDWTPDDFSAGEETDPIYSADPASGIVEGDITNWNTAFGWGDHATAGYLTEYTETDPIFVASPANGIAAADITNWDNAFGWGDHAAEDYIADGDAAGGDLDGFYPDPTIADNAIDSDKIENGSIIGEDIHQMSAINGQVLKWNGTQWAPGADVGGGAGDDWGAQVVQKDATLTGSGITGDELGLAQQGATLGQALIWDGSDWTPDDFSAGEETDPIYSADPASGIVEGDITNWNTAFGWGDHATAGYLTEYTETDPIFVASPANGIAAADITNWNTAFGWGDHATAGYLTEYTETDPIFVASPANGIAAADITNWDNAYGWGDHAGEGYIADGDAAGGDLDGTYPNPTIADDAIGVDHLSQMGATAGHSLVWNGTQWVTGLPSGFVLPYYGTTSSSQVGFHVSQSNINHAAIRGTNSAQNSYGELGYDGNSGELLNTAGVYGEYNVGVTYGAAGTSLDGLIGHSNKPLGFGLYAKCGASGAGALYAISGNPSASAVFAEHDDNNNQAELATTDVAVYGIHGTSGAYGNIGTADYGAYGENSNGNYGYIGSEYQGVYGADASSGNFGSLGSNANGVYGENANGNYGEIASTNYGLIGTHNAGNYGQIGGSVFGVKGVNSSNSNTGILGSTSSGVIGTSTDDYGVAGTYGNETSGNETDDFIGVLGYNGSETGTEKAGVYGEDIATTNFGALGTSDEGARGESLDSYGVWGEHNNNTPSDATDDVFGILGFPGGLESLLGNAGVYGENETNGNFGFLGNNYYGAYGECVVAGNYGAIGTQAYGVYGFATTSAASEHYGVKGVGDSDADGGIYGYIENTTLPTERNPDLTYSGVIGRYIAGTHGFLGNQRYGVYGYNQSGNTEGYFASSAYGVLGRDIDTGNWGALGGSSFGARGTHLASLNRGELGTAAYGVWGTHNTSGCGGYIGGSDYGVYGSTGNTAADIGVRGYHQTTGNYGHLGTEDYGVYGIDGSGYNYGYLGGINAVAGIASHVISAAVYGRHEISNAYGYLGWAAGAYGEWDDNGNYGKLGTEVFGIIGENKTTEAPGVAYDEKYAGVLGYHEDSENYGFLGNRDYGVYGYAAISTDDAIYGENIHGESGYIGGAYGVYGQDAVGNWGYVGSSTNSVLGYCVNTDAPGSTYTTARAGVVGYHQNSQNLGYLANADYGVYGYAATSTDKAVYGENTHGEYGYIGGSYGVYGEDANGHYGYLGGSTYGAYGKYDEDSDNYGILGGASYGVFGYASESGEYAIYGSSASGWAGYFNGDAYFNGVVGINDASPTYALDFPNNSSTSQGWIRCYEVNETSDSRVKFNQEPIQYGLDQILQIIPKKYDHHSSVEDSTGIHILDEYESRFGIIAQELYEVIPEAVQKPKDENTELWGISYMRLIPVLVKAIQEQNETIISQKSEIELLREEIELIKQEIKSMK